MGIQNGKILQYFMYCFFFLSGITGLIYEVVWGKYLALFMGNAAYANVVVLATFMGGLSLGNYYIGKYSDKYNNRIKLYAFLEIGIGIYCLLFLILVSLFSSLYIAIASNFNLDSFVIYILKFIFSVVLIIFPTFLMGGTLPVLSKFFVESTERITETSLNKGKIISNLYFLNSLGAVIGGLLTGFYFIPNIGLIATVIIGVFINLIIGTAVLGINSFLSNKKSESMESNETQKVEIVEENNNEEKDNLQVTDLNDLPSVKKQEKKIITIALVSIALSGFCSFLYELVWIRMLSSVIGSSTYSFTLMLASFIFGIALGSIIIHSKVDKLKKPLFVFGVLELVLAFVLVFTVILYEKIPYYFYALKSALLKTETAFSIYEIFKIFVCLLVMLIPTTIIGTTLPIVANFLTGKIKTFGKDLGKVFSVNTLGCVAGAVVTGLILIPLIGTRLTFELGILINILIGFVVLSIYLNKVNKVLFAIALFIFVMFFKLSYPGDWSNPIKIGGSFLEDVNFKSYDDYLNFYKPTNVLFYKEDANTSVTVIENFSQRENMLIRSLKVNGKSDASNYPSDLPTQLLLAHIPMLLNKNPTDVAVIGLGSGATAGNVLLYNSVKTLDIIEISSAVVKAARDYFYEMNFNCLDNPRTNLFVEDAKTFLKVVDKKYSAIISEPSNPWIAGVSELFTKEFFQVCKDKLADDGVLVQWFHLYDMSNDSVRLIIETFNSVFKTVTIWKAVEGDILIVGHKSDFLNVDFNRIDNMLKNNDIKTNLNKINIFDTSNFLLRQVISEFTVSTIKGSNTLNSDYFPLLEYSAPKDLFLNKNSDLIINIDERINNPTNLLISKYFKNRNFTEEELYNIMVYLIKYEMNSRAIIDFYFKKCFDSFTNPIYLFNLAKELEKMEVYDMAIVVYKKLVDMDKKEEYVYSYANVLYKKAINLNFSSAASYYNKAVELYQELLTKAEKEKDKYYFNISLCYFRQNMFKPALEYALNSVNYRQENKNVIGNLSTTIKEDELYSQTASIYIRLIMEEQDFKLKDEYSIKAYDYLNKALTFNPNFVPARDMLKRFFNK